MKEFHFLLVDIYTVQLRSSGTKRVSWSCCILKWCTEIQYDVIYKSLLNRILQIPSRYQWSSLAVNRNVKWRLENCQQLIDESVELKDWPVNERDLKDNIGHSVRMNLKLLKMLNWRWKMHRDVRVPMTLRPRGSHWTFQFVQ